MERLKEKEHDFSSKLRQREILQRLKDYVHWQRDWQAGIQHGALPFYSPISINLDLTSACNFSCAFCVDSKLINEGKSLTLKKIEETIDTLSLQGLRSIILIGGGEPTLHPHFGEIVRHIKNKKLQVGIVTNGSRLEKIEEVAGKLEEKDWVRISMDAASEGVFKDIHSPKTSITFHEILKKAKELKEKNPIISLGYSFVIVWEGVEINGRRLRSNLHEIIGAVKLAKEFSFDYVSFKPCLIRMNDSQRETLLKDVKKTKEMEIIEQIRRRLQDARLFTGDSNKILESSNLKAMLNQETDQIKRQPKRCHMQFFRTVVSPFGIFHCPAFRGVKEAKIGEPDGYLTVSQLKESLRKTADLILTFNAEEECKDVGCFYNRTNWWLEDLIHSDKDLHQIEEVENDNFFL